MSTSLTIDRLGASGIPEPDTLSLLEEARRGSREAVDALFTDCREHLMGSIRGRLGSSLRTHLESADILQVTLMRGFERISQFQGTSRRSLLAWLSGIARNAIRDQVDYLRRDRRDVWRTVPLDELTDGLPASRPCQVRQLIAKEEASRLADALASLERDQRAVVLLRVHEDLSFPEIGRRLGKSPDACRMRLARATRALARELRGEDEGSATYGM